MGMIHPHVEPPPIPLIKETDDGKSEKYFVNFKLHRYPTFSTLDLYEFKFDLIENGDSEEFLLFVCNFNTTLTASGALQTGAKYQHLLTIVRGEELRQFDLFYADVEGTQTLNVEEIIRSLSQ